MKGLTSEEHAILLRAEKNEVRALQHGAEVSNMAPGLVQVSSRQTVGQADRLSAKPLTGVNVPGFPASACALEAAAPAMSTDAYQGRHLDDNPKREKGHMKVYFVMKWVLGLRLKKIQR